MLGPETLFSEGINDILPVDYPYELIAIHNRKDKELR
jgi:hypothetical protein